MVTGKNQVIASAKCLWETRIDPGIRPGAVYQISDINLASRLSFFLWSSIPDDELLELAAKGQLRQPDVLQGQVERMLRDERSEAFITNFFGQWLSVRNLEMMAPAPKVYPAFDENLREAFQAETELFLRAQVRENRSALELLTADYTYVNDRLARFYGIPNVYGEHFRRVALPGESRAGILGHGSFLTVTSYANRTSPVGRGKWLLTNILGIPPPPPPPNVPEFPETTESEGHQPKSVRERMEQHRKNPICASCHSKIDPLGFAFENFDGIGAWRTTDSGTPVDASGILPDGTPFARPGEFP